MASLQHSSIELTAIHAIFNAEMSCERQPGMHFISWWGKFGTRFPFTSPAAPHILQRRSWRQRSSFARRRTSSSLVRTSLVHCNSLHSRHARLACSASCDWRPILCFVALAHPRPLRRLRRHGQVLPAQRRSLRRQARRHLYHSPDGAFPRHQAEPMHALAPHPPSLRQLPFASCSRSLFTHHRALLRAL